eukprot:CAMPEP_0119004530 /NCGR_PEP_ID=MMETSP1176-20130426/1195_1 /TAXON_ID=265551 /ORGANISM="Synedropsis recta cf, Strain CCMP1620" /LENGTH=563 /DNA_ID=CAMNT_0006956245 /DNA_START=251 /DNA_END=1939 /DNA_ORIENTATION=+
MALRQRAARGTVLPLQRPPPPAPSSSTSNGSHASTTHGNNGTSTTSATATATATATVVSLSNAFLNTKRKLRRSNPNVFFKAYLPLIGFFSVVMGCTYLALGGQHGTLSGHHHYHPHQAEVDDRVKPHIYRRKLTTDEDHDKTQSEGGLRDADKQQKAWLERETHKLEADREKREEEFEKQKEQLRMERKLEEELLEKEKQQLARLKEEERKEELALKQEEEKLHQRAFIKSHKVDNWMEICEKNVRDTMRTATAQTQETFMQSLEDLAMCAEAPLTKNLVKLNRDLSQEAKVRMDIAAKLENYTCVDPDAPASPDVSSHIWTLKDGSTRKVHIKHDRPASQIHVVDNFINEEECLAMETAASKSLHRATVADGKGGSQYSDNRKAMQAGIRVPWHHEAEGDPIARLSRRVYDYTNHVTGLSIDEHGQEDLMSIQYFGRGVDDDHPDRYMPHCDGGCTGLPFRNGTRMATMVVYCTLPEKGGSTNFRNAGVHVKAQKGAAVFFSYMDPKSFLTDDRFTEHSGCPVFEGEKKIVTQWIRLGVDKENPWTSYNTMGIKLKDASEY